MSHQDWNTVDIGKSSSFGGGKVIKTENKAMTSIKINPNSSKNIKLEEETETFKIQKSGQELGKALMKARMAKGKSQKILANDIKERVQVIQQYESGKAIPNPQIITKLERLLGVKLPRPKKIKKTV